jgi:hypothetical protein
MPFTLLLAEQVIQEIWRLMRAWGLAWLSFQPGDHHGIMDQSNPMENSHSPGFCHSKIGKKQQKTLQGCNTAVAFLTNKNIQKPTNKEAPGNPIPIFPAKSPGLWSNSYSWATRPEDPSGKSWEMQKPKNHRK